MQIKFARSGGFAGAATNVAGTVEFQDHGAKVRGDNTSYGRELSEQEAGKLLSSASPSVITQAGRLAAGTAPVPDGYQYDVTVVTADGKSHPLTWNAGNSENLAQSSAAAANLVSWVEDETQNIWMQKVSSRK